MPSWALNAQSPGDTIVVNALDYKSKSRDTMVAFPDDNLTYEKIILKYGMRCKNGLVSTGNDRNRGCGEWDYSCNTYIVDSSKIEDVLTMHPDYTISGFVGDTFDYTTRQTYDYYQYSQDVLTVDTVSENIFSLSAGGEMFDKGIIVNSLSGQFLFVYTAEELTASGFSAGEIDGISLNVLNAGGEVHFVKVELAAQNDASLNIPSARTLDFDLHLNRDLILTQGENKLIFTKPYQWDGVSSIVFKVSYTNSGGQDPIHLDADATANTECFYAHNNYNVDLGQNGRFDINSSLLSGIENELTVSMWVRGNPEFLPANTSILWGYDSNPNDRDLNIHLPWGNSQVYFDCGFSNGFDRINKVATKDQYAGQWNYWTFSKDANNGDMKIYINGAPWHSGTGLVRTISINNLILGMTHTMSNNYKGDIAELRIWDKALTDAQILNWQYDHISETHPEYDHLVAYYNFSEGSGVQINDPKNTVASMGENIYWKYQRGDEIFRDFHPSAVKPAIAILSGEYNISSNPVYKLDSVQRAPNVVRQYEVVSNAGQLKDDDLVVINTYEYFEATPEVLYDGETGDVITQYPVELEGRIIVNQLEYIRRFPFYNEIMSFVTPYGIGVDFGPDGVAWYFDLTDYTPILKGNKRLLMTLGGQYQEEMDLDFLFIVGTPPRDVLEFNQLWQGTPRLGSAHINQIRSDEKFAPLMVPTHPEGKKFKLMSTITGHGAEGEFHQNGGLVRHMINLDGGFDEFIWTITQECSLNPVFPQGGTWVYDRQGWCPGERSLTTENDITYFVTPGSDVQIDYNTSPPPSQSGDYRYIVSHQLVTYGDPNHANDASILEIRKPNDNVLYTRLNPACDQPVVVIQNTGEEELQAVTIEYWVNDGNKKSYEWTGRLPYMLSREVELPAGDLFAGLSGADVHTFHVEIKAPNDEYAFNNTMKSKFKVVDVYEDGIILEVRTNNRNFENRYTIKDEAGNTLTSNNLQFSNRVFRDTITTQGCYVFQITDTGDDGLSWWANPNQGSGHMIIRDLTGIRPLKTLQPDFGRELTYSFNIGMVTNVSQKELDSEISIYPNPVEDQATVSGLRGDELITLFNSLGNFVPANINFSGNSAELDVSGLVSGIYYVKIRRGDSYTTRKLSVVR
jgi:hypothetical protein